MNSYLGYLVMKEFTNCPSCGSDTLGNGKGSLIIDQKGFKRACQCGYMVQMNKQEVADYVKKNRWEEEA